MPKIFPLTIPLTRLCRRPSSHGLGHDTAAVEFTAAINVCF